ncbi:hypothetical protein [Rhodococcus triatomae]|nr:hypothetical protein G419_00290 [Rhodococcus triatomae BKS 15-14]
MDPATVFTAYFEKHDTPKVVWDDAELFGARVFGRIRVVQESTGADADTVLHDWSPDWSPDVLDNALVLAGWRRRGEWRHHYLCAVERL